MITQSPPAQLDAHRLNPARRLQGFWLWIARGVWMALFGLMLALNVAAMAAHIEGDATGSGVSGLAVDRTVAHAYQLQVEPDGPAARAGIQEGDHLLALNGIPLQPGMSSRQVNLLLHGKIGDTLRLTVQGADGEIRQHAVTLVEEDLVWRRFRLPLARAGFYFPLLEAVLLLSYLVTALLIFWRRSDDWMALYLSATLMLITPQLSYSWYFLYEQAAEWEMWIGLVVAIAVAFTLPNFYLLPDGRFVPRWTVALAAIWVVWTITLELFPKGPLSIYEWSGVAQLSLWLAWFTTGILAQVYRFRHVASPVEQQQIKWLGFGLAVAAVVNLGWTLAFELFPLLNQPGFANLVMWLLGRTGYVLGMMLLPVSFGIAVFRYRLWQIDHLINRTLVYGTLTTLVVAIYVITVTTLDRLFNTTGSIVSQIVAITLDLILFDPLRERLQNLADRLMFRDRAEAPAPSTNESVSTSATVAALPAVVTRLGQRVTTAAGPEAELPAIVETVAEALHLPYVAIALAENGAFRVAAAHGEPVAATFSWPLVFQGQPVGQLIFAARTPGEPFTPADWQLLESIAYQASLTAHHVLLAHELQRQKVQQTIAP